MSNFSHSEAVHLIEGDLVRYMDAEMNAAERGSVAAHLLCCQPCSESLDSLRKTRAQFASLLVDMPAAPINAARRARSWERVAAAESRRGSSARRAGLRAAAVGAVLVGGVLSASPVRALVADLWRTVVAGTGAIEVPASAIEASPETIVLTDVTVGFVPVGRVFNLDIATAQQAGALILGISDGASVTVHAVGGTDPVDLVVLPSGMRIENGASASGDYAVRIPSHIEEVRIRIAGQQPVVIRTAELASTWVSVVRLDTMH
jgi:hypothetical protein